MKSTSLQRPVIISTESVKVLMSQAADRVEEPHLEERG